MTQQTPVRFVPPSTLQLRLPQETPRSHLKPSALPILPLFSLAGAEDTGADGGGKGPPPASTAGAPSEALPLPSSALTAQTTPEEQSARTGHEFGALSQPLAYLLQV